MNGRRHSGSIPGFLEATAGMEMDPGMYVSPEVMAVFNDGGGVDVASLFHSDFSQQPTNNAGDAVMYGSNGTAGLVTTP